MDTVRALRQVIMFKEVPEPVLKIVAGTARRSRFRGERSSREGQARCAVRHPQRYRASHARGARSAGVLRNGRDVGDVLFIDADQPE